MCGLVGYVLEEEVPADPRLLEEMLGFVRHRGPDGEGVMLASRGRATIRHLHTDRSPARVRTTTLPLRSDGGTLHDVAIVHSRYAVVDRSPEAHQPWTTLDEELTVAFQGEIFNYPELRRSLEGRGLVFRTRSDTEVLAQALAHWGDGCWARFNGFWAAAAFDRLRGELLLSRDRMGIAPLYVAREPGRLWFSSSAFALASLMKRRRAMDRRRAAAFLVTGMRDFDGGTLFDGVEAFPPGAFLRLPAGRARMVDPCPTSFWVLPDPAEVHDRSLDEAAERLRELLDSAVRMRMRGDLSVAFQLSGGLDSAAVVALACSGAPREVAAYTVSVPEADEAPLAATMSRLHPVRRTVLRGGEGSLVEELGSFTRLMEEPVQAPGAWANHDLCRRMQMDGFGVVVSGSGGDEVLAGYEGDFWPGARLALRRRGRWLQVLEYDLVLRYGTTGRMRSSLRGWTRWVRRIPHRLAARLDPNDRPPRADSISEEGSGHEGAALLARYARLDYVNRRRYHFRRANLPYYLASNDHATLGIPVEHRQPFLDHRVVELGLSLPPEHLFRRGWTKYVLRHAMRGLIPEEILWRREKTGFPFPLRRFLLTHAAELAPIAGRWQGWGTADATVSFRTMVCSDPSRAWRNVAMGSWMEIL